MLRFWFMYWKATSGRHYPCRAGGSAVFPETGEYPDYDGPELDAVAMTLDKNEAIEWAWCANSYIDSSYGIAYVDIDVRSSDS